ncbi:hypothetical protein [Pseudomarimonas arenosa]|uniref:Uncharacterized protein n=1 Tax=Pseudomarimonas arenosa TaxID=2774145 RepID=A0AAW3ZIF8_9GAMM|nr:hypothetical protein [Pseudomarimonas arenosa]MBD8524121.1 hypothetical protein [Pseudomarimonas arenosa]
MKSNNISQDQLNADFIRQNIVFEAPLPGTKRWVVVREAGSSGGNANKHYAPKFLCVEVVDDALIQKSKVAEGRGRSVWTSRTPGVRTIFRQEFNAFAGRGPKSYFAKVQASALEAVNRTVQGQGQGQA